MTTSRSFTACMANIPSVLDQPYMDITVYEDEVVGYRTAGLGTEGTGETDEEPERAPAGQEMFYAVTSVPAREGDVDDGIREAEALMMAAGWETTGTWEAHTDYYSAPVEYRGAYLHIIEQTNNAEDPVWFEVTRGGVAVEHEDGPEDYGRRVLAGYRPDNGPKTPTLVDQNGNPHFRILVRTQDDSATLAVVESTRTTYTHSKPMPEPLRIAMTNLLDHGARVRPEDAYADERGHHLIARSGPLTVHAVLTLDHHADTVDWADGDLRWTLIRDGSILPAPEHWASVVALVRDAQSIVPEHIADGDELFVEVIGDHSETWQSWSRRLVIAVMDGRTAREFVTRKVCEHNGRLAYDGPHLIIRGTLLNESSSRHAWRLSRVTWPAVGERVALRDVRSAGGRTYTARSRPHPPTAACT